MQPDYTSLVNEFIKPVVSLLLFVFLVLGWVTAFRLMKENTILRIKLGKEDEKVSESFKIWILRNSAPMITSYYTFKSFLQEKQIYPEFKSVFKKKLLKLAYRIQAISGMVSNIFGIDTRSAG